METRGTLTYPEISAQHGAIRAAWQQLSKQQDWVDAYFRNPAYEEVIFIGSGSSYYQAQTMAATFRKWTTRAASAHPSSEIFLFRDTIAPADRKVLLVGVSRSGESSEVILALESVKNLPQWDVCGVTCYEDSKLAQIAPCLISPLGKEKSTVMTQSLSSMTFLTQAAIASVSPRSAALLGELEQIVNGSEALVNKADAYMREFVTGHDFDKFIYLGMGAYVGLAHEACLKLKEMAYLWTESFGTLEFRHGPKSVVEPGTLVCILLSETARAYELKVAEEMQGYGGKVLLITARAGADTAFADFVFETGGAALSDEARSVWNLPAVQYLGYFTAMKQNVDPDNPRNLTQVVKI